MAGIEQQVRGLIFAEQNISLRISHLITVLPRGYGESKKEPTKVKHSPVVFFLRPHCGILSLLLILFIVLLIVNDLNKGQKAQRR